MGNRIFAVCKRDFKTEIESKERLDLMFAVIRDDLALLDKVRSEATVLVADETAARAFVLEKIYSFLRRKFQAKQMSQ